MYTYNEAARLSFVVQEIIMRRLPVDTEESAAALLDAGYLMGLAHGGCPVEDQSFQRAAALLDGFVKQYGEVSA